MEKLPVYILAGGKSSRFGSDKARALYNGKPLIIQVKNSLEPVAASIRAITDKPNKYDDLGIESIVDIYPDKGPLGGLHTAISDMHNDGWFLLIQCDLVGLKIQWIEQLMQFADNENEAVVFRDDKYWQVIPGLFHTKSGKQVLKHLHENVLKVALTIDKLKVKAVELPEDWHRAKDVNSLSDLAEIED